MIAKVRNVRVRLRLRVTLRMTLTNSSWRRGPSDSRPELFSQLNTCGHSPYITSSLTRGWACHLQVRLVHASAFILWSESRETRDYILLLQIRYFPFCSALARDSSNCKIHKDYNRKCSVRKKLMVVSHKGLVAKTN
jgi:hypothetical protein